MPYDRYVVDTCALISYFSEIFEVPSTISTESIEIIDNAFYAKTVKLIFPATVFIEIFNKWFTNAEIAEKIKIEIYHRIKNCENMEIQPFEKEVLENFILITGIEKKYNFDNHDKQILAAAMMLNCPLITSDECITRYNKRKRVIPEVYN